MIEDPSPSETLGRDAADEREDVMESAGLSRTVGAPDTTSEAIQILQNEQIHSAVSQIFDFRNIHFLTLHLNEDVIVCLQTLNAYLNFISDRADGASVRASLSDDTYASRVFIADVFAAQYLNEVFMTLIYMTVSLMFV